MTMEFLSKEGLSHLVDKIKSSFTTKEEFRKKTQKKVEETICVRKAIKLNSVWHNVSYYHASFFDIPINLTFRECNGGEGTLHRGGYYRFKDTYGRYPITGLCNQKGNVKDYTCTLLSNNIFQVSELPFSSDSWVDWILRFDEDMVGGIRNNPNIIKVIAVNVVPEDGKEIIEVTLDIKVSKLDADYLLIANRYNGKTSSPYFELYNGVVRPIMGKEEKLPFIYPENFETAKENHIFKSVKTIVYNEYVNGRIKPKNRVELYMNKKYTNARLGDRDPKHAYRYKLSNRQIIKKDDNGDTIEWGGTRWTRGGRALLKWYHRGICVGTKHLFINFHSKKGRMFSYKFI